MFSFKNKRARAADEVALYLQSLFTGLIEEDGERLSDQVFADPYVAGFLQVLTTHAVANIYHFRMPDSTTINDILEECLNRLVPGCGATFRRTLDQSSAPTHPLHARYIGGRHIGSEHVQTLFTNDGISRNEHHRSFRNYLKSHYL